MIERGSIAATPEMVLSEFDKRYRHRTGDSTVAILTVGLPKAALCRGYTRPPVGLTQPGSSLSLAGRVDSAETSSMLFTEKISMEILNGPGSELAI